jgi:hypothetical protein
MPDLTYFYFFQLFSNCKVYILWCQGRKGHFALTLGTQLLNHVLGDEEIMEQCKILLGSNLPR